MVKHITKDTIQYNIKKKMYSLLYFILNLKKKIFNDSNSNF